MENMISTTRKSWTPKLNNLMFWLVLKKIIKIISGNIIQGNSLNTIYSSRTYKGLPDSEQAGYSLSEIFRSTKLVKVRAKSKHRMHLNCMRTLYIIGWR